MGDINVIQKMSAVIYDKADKALNRLNGVIRDKNNKNLPQLYKIRDEIQGILRVLTTDIHIQEEFKNLKIPENNKK